MGTAPSMPFPSVRTLFVCVLHHFKILHYLLQPPGSQVVEVKGLTPTPTGDPPHPSLNREGASFPALPIRLRLMRRVSAIFLNFVPSCLCVSLKNKNLHKSNANLSSSSTFLWDYRRFLSYSFTF